MSDALSWSCHTQSFAMIKGKSVMGVTRQNQRTSPNRSAVGAPLAKKKKKGRLVGNLYRKRVQKIF